MNGERVLAQDAETTFESWHLTQTIELARQRTELEQEWEKLEKERETFLREKRDFDRQKELENKRLAQTSHLFEMKWKILEEELVRFANEKQRMEQQKAFYEHVREYEAKQDAKKETVSGELFFKGVHSASSLKRRYKDLLRIYHPDNQDGDTQTIQEINREYDDLTKRFCG